MRFAIVAHRAGETNIGLITRGWRRFEPLLLTPREALATLRPRDAALGRLDIRDELDGIEAAPALPVRPSNQQTWVTEVTNHPDEMHP